MEQKEIILAPELVIWVFPIFVNALFLATRILPDAQCALDKYMFNKWINQQWMIDLMNDYDCFVPDAFWASYLGHLLYLLMGAESLPL